MYYAMNSKTKVPTAEPYKNEFDHTLQSGAVFAVLVDAQSGRGVKMFGAYGGDFEVGAVLAFTQDTGLGHRKMAAQRVLAVFTPQGLKGTLPKTRALPYWVAK